MGNYVQIASHVQKSLKSSDKLKTDHAETPKFTATHSNVIFIFGKLFKKIHCWFFLKNINKVIRKCMLNKTSSGYISSINYISGWEGLVARIMRRRPKGRNDNIENNYDHKSFLISLIGCKCHGHLFFN